MSEKPTIWRNRIVGRDSVDARTIVPHDRNWRKHGAAQKAAMASVMGEVGWVQDVIVNRTTGRLIDGHMRVEMAAARGETVPVVYVELTEAEEKIVLATFDPLGDLAGADDERLLALMREADADRIFVQIFGEGALDPKAGLTDPDEVPEPLAEVVTRAGDLWTMGAHRLLCGDSTGAMSYAALMGDTRADMVFTDPPYGVNYTGGMKPREKLAADHAGTDIYARALAHLRLAAADHAALYLWYADAHAAAAAAAAAGYIITAQIIWVKNNAQFMSSAHYHGKHEPCFFAHRRGCSARWKGPTNEVTVWEVDRASSNDYHPTQKPVALARRAIRNSSGERDVVLDLFGGSGSTLIAAEELSRRARLIEIEPRYCDVIVRRWQQFTGRVAHDENGETFDSRAQGVSYSHGTEGTGKEADANPKARR